jgi:hypothetical protein
MIACAIFLTGPARAQEKALTIEISPYLWLTNIDGSVTVGDQTADFEASFGDLVDVVDLAAAVMGSISYDRWVGFSQADYYSLNPEFTAQDGRSGELNSSAFLLTGTGGYRIDGFSEGSTIDLLSGVRYFRIHNKVSIAGAEMADTTSNLVDAIVMVRSSFPLNFISEKLHFTPMFSVGAGESDLVWEAQPQLHYQFGYQLSGFFGYRRLQYDFSENGADLDLGFQGFLFGLTVRR